MNTNPGNSRGAAQSNLRSFWMLGSAIVVAIGIVGAWFVLSTAKPGDPAGAALSSSGKNYLPAKHMDAEAARLSPAADGKATLRLVLRGVEQGGHLMFTMREPPDKSSLLVFVANGDPTTTIGNLAATTEGTGNAGETLVTIDLDRMPAHLTVIDVRWDGGRWEGFEIGAPAGGSPK